VSGLISGVAVAIIGFYATNIYNRRQTAAEEARKAAEERPQEPRDPVRRGPDRREVHRAFGLER